MQDTTKIHTLRSKKSRKRALDFLTHSECKNFYLLEGVSSQKFPPYLYGIYSDGKLRGIIYSRNGPHLHLHLDQIINTHLYADIKKFLLSYFSSSFLLFGEEHIIAPFIHRNLLPPKKIRNYHFMRLDRHSYYRNINNILYSNARVTKKTLTVHDARPLSELQAHYEAEELHIDEQQLDHHKITIALVHRIKLDTLTALYDRNIPVAIASVNARFQATCQIGSVFVLPEYRNQGIGTILLKTHLEKLLHHYTTIVLFVDIHNHAAIHLYQKLGFYKNGRLMQVNVE